jgi:hypothetical protein
MLFLESSVDCTGKMPALQEEPRPKSTIKFSHHVSPDDLAEFLITSKVSDASGAKERRLRRMNNTSQGGASKGNAADDALMVDQGAREAWGRQSNLVGVL